MAIITGVAALGQKRGGYTMGDSEKMKKFEFITRIAAAIAILAAVFTLVFHCLRYW